MIKKLTIAIVCDAIDDDTMWGSVISGKRFAAWLAKKGHTIVWITSKFLQSQHKQQFAYAHIYEFPYLPRIGAYGMHFWYTSVRKIVNILRQEQVDIVYSIQPTILARQAVRAAKKLHIPAISHSHTLPESFVPGAPAYIQKLVKKFVLYMYKKYDGIISPTQFLKQKYDEWLVDISQAVIGNGVNTNIFCPIQKANSPFTLLFVGRLDPSKNVSLLLDALHYLHIQRKLPKDIQCMIVGGGVQEEYLHQQTKRYMLEEYVRFIGKLPSESLRLVQAYQEASVFVFPSLYETEGMVVLEAMACGCTLLVANSPHSAAKDFVKDNGYTFAIDTPQDLADKIYTLSTHRDICTLMGKVSEREAQDFSFEKSVWALEKFLQSFISS